MLGLGMKLHLTLDNVSGLFNAVFELQSEVRNNLFLYQSKSRFDKDHDVVQNII
jgi:hypothetical protein